jgi:hypothetical protein
MKGKMMKILAKQSPWEVAMMAGLLANAVARPLVMALDRAFVLPGLLFTLLPLVMIAFVWTQNRWLITLVTIINALSLFGALREPLVQTRLANPDVIGYFVVALLELLGGVLTTTAGFVVLVQGFFTMEIDQ